MVEFQYTGVGKGTAVKIALDGSAFNAFAGEIKHSARNGTGIGEWFNGITLNTFCTEIEQHTSGSWLQFTISNPGLVTPANPVAAKTQALADMFALLQTRRGTNAFNNDMAAAFQIAVWEIVYDFNAEAGRSSLDITSGRFDARSTNGNPLAAGISSKVNEFWDAIGGGARTLDVFGFHNSTAQDQIVPTPGGLALGGLGLIAMGRRRRK
jgi:uncharacterized protein (TIGR03382 family)